MYIVSMYATCLLVLHCLSKTVTILYVASLRAVLIHTFVSFGFRFAFLKLISASLDVVWNVTGVFKVV